MSESVLPKYMSHRNYNQTPTTRRDLFTSDERMELVDQAMSERANSTETVPQQSTELSSAQEATVAQFAETLDTLQYVADIEGLGERLAAKRKTAITPAGHK